MNDAEIKSHNFDMAKSQIKTFSEQIPASVTLGTVRLKGPIGINDHKVTGPELNKLVAEIQSHFVSIYKVLDESTKEFGQVYNALEALDQDYIQGILISIKAAQEASHQAKSAAEEAKQNTRDLAKAIEVLKLFKSELERLKHLVNVDDLWQDAQDAKRRLDALQVQQKDLRGDLESLSTDQKAYSAETNRRLTASEESGRHTKSVAEDAQRAVEQIREIVGVLGQFKEEMERLEHLRDVDQLWKESQDLQQRLANHEEKHGALKSEFEKFVADQNERSVRLHRQLRNAVIVSIVAVSLSVATLVLNAIGIL